MPRFFRKFNASLHARNEREMQVKTSHDAAMIAVVTMLQDSTAISQ